MKSDDELCSAVVRVARESCIDLIAEAINVHGKFSKILLLFGKCHSGVNSGIIDEASINKLGKLQIPPPPQQTMFMLFLFAETNIGTFMACYRESFQLQLCCQKCTSWKTTLFPGCAGGVLEQASWVNKELNQFMLTSIG